MMQMVWLAATHEAHSLAEEECFQKKDGFRSNQIRPCRQNCRVWVSREIEDTTRPTLTTELPFSIKLCYIALRELKDVYACMWMYVHVRSFVCMKETKKLLKTKKEQLRDEVGGSSV